MVKISRINQAFIGLSFFILGSFCLAGFWSCAAEADANQLFRQNFHPYPNVLVKLDQQSTPQDERRDFFLAYRDRNFGAALQHTQALEPLAPENPMQIYKAVCLMSLEQYQEAIAPLQGLANIEGTHQDAARWYLGLNYLKLGQLDACKAQLVLLKNTSTYIRNEAKVLISKLNG